MDEKRTWTKVNSSRLDSVEFDPMTRTLFVRFPANKQGDMTWGGYPNVSPELFNEIINAPSVGQKFNQTIIANPKDYPWKRMGTERQDESEEPVTA